VTDGKEISIAASISQSPILNEPGEDDSPKKTFTFDSVLNTDTAQVNLYGENVVGIFGEKYIRFSIDSHLCLYYSPRSMRAHAVRLWISSSMVSTPACLCTGRQALVRFSS
jgi:hypothetical protein